MKKIIKTTKIKKKYKIEIIPAKENKLNSNLYNLFKKNFLSNNNLCNQSTLTLFIIGLLIYDIYLSINKK